MRHFDSVATAVGAINGLYMSGFAYSKAPTAYQGTKVVDRSAQACASAAGAISAWTVDDGNKVAVLEGVDTTDASVMDKLIDIANDSAIGMIIHATGGE